MPIGYRLYYQSMQYLEDPLNLTASYLEKNYDHINVSVEYNFNQHIAISQLEVFTNYSIAVAAYNRAFVGPAKRIFWRTNQGG